MHGVGLALLCAGILLLVGGLSGFQFLDLILHDWRYRLRGPVAASDRVALVEVDDATLGAFRNWPLPRKYYAVVLAALEQAGAQGIAFDLLFLGEQADRRDDLLLASVSTGRTNLVHAMGFLPDDPAFWSGTSTQEGDVGPLIRHGRPVTRQRIASARQVALPYPELLEAADALGHTAVAVDPDGVVRRVPQFIRFGDWAYPSLAIRLIESAARSDSSLPQFELSDDGILLHWRGRRVRVPSDSEGATSIVFAGERASFVNTHSMLRVLQWYRDGDTTSLARAFRGKLVIVGTTAIGEVATDVGATPFAAAVPLVYIHANAVNAALQGRFLSRPPAWILALGLIVLAAALGALFATLSLWRSIVIAITAVLFVGVADYVLFVAADQDLSPSAALMLPPLAWIAVEGARRRAVERRARERGRELQIARGIQQHLLPASPPDVPEIEVFAINEPMEEVGGDYYDWVPMGDDLVALAVGDVSGHGIPAALLMSHLHASFHAETRTGASANAILTAMNVSLARAASSGRYATFFLALASRREHKMWFCNAGHNPPLLVRGGAVELLEGTGFPLGMFDSATYELAERPFGSGDVLVVYSDGVTEAMCRDEEYGEERLKAKVLALLARSLEVSMICAGVLEDVAMHTQGAPPEDDVTIMVARRR